MALTSNLDVTVSQVNAQLGALMRRDLGLGLLFVTGQVAALNYGPSGRLAGFVLHDGEADLRADLAPSVRNPPALEVGQYVRVTAWLGFYYLEGRFRLVVRDVEPLPAPGVEPTTAEPGAAQPVVARPATAQPAEPAVVAPAAVQPAAIPAEAAPAPAAPPAPPSAPPMTEPPAPAPAEVTAADFPPREAAPAEPGSAARLAASLLFGPEDAARPAAPPADDTLQLEPAVLPPWLEEIRQRQFAAGQAPASQAPAGQAPAGRPATEEAFLAGETIPTAAVALGHVAGEEQPAAPAGSEAELQLWLAQLFDASEQEDIELTRNEGEIVAVRRAGSADRFHTLGAEGIARFQDPGRRTPPPASITQEIVRQDTMIHVPFERAAAGALPPGATRPGAPVRSPAGGLSALQAPPSPDEPVPSSGQPHPALVALGLLALFVLLALLATAVTYWVLARVL
jgi:hypothetical protein